MTTPVDYTRLPGLKPIPAGTRSFLIRERKGPTIARRAFTAAASRIDLTTPATAAPRGGSRSGDGWQSDAWAYRDAVGEVRYANTFKANVAARMRLFAAVAAPEGDDPIPVEKAVENGDLSPQLAADAREQVVRLAQGRVHAGKILASFAEILSTPGEGYIVGREMPNGAEHWQVYSTDEVKYDDKGWYLAAETGSSGGQDVSQRLDPDTSYVSRVWRPHPRYSQRADSPMRALLDTCEELLVVGRAIRAETRSRVHAGILYINSELVNAARVNEDPEDPEATPPLVQDIADSMTAAVGDESSPDTLVPTMVTGSLPFSEAMGHLSMARTIDTSLLERQKAALTRLGMGLDVPPEIITGLAQVNHWTGWLVDDSTFRNHVEPDVQMMVDGITVSMFRDSLLELGHPVEQVERLLVWYDPADAVTAPNRGAEADAAYDRGAISEEAYRAARGFDETSAPTGAERVLSLVMSRGPLTAEGTLALLGALLKDVQIPDVGVPDAPALLPAAPVIEPDAPPVEQPTTPGPAAPPGKPAAVTASAEANRADRLSRQLADVDRSLRERLHVAADMALQHALESAGRKVRTAAGRKDRALYASLQDVPAAAVTAAAGREAITAALGLDEQQLLAAALDGLAGQWTTWVGEAGGQVVGLVAELAGWRDDDPRRGSLATSLAAGAVAGWSWLAQRLNDLAVSLLYDPANPDAEPAERGVPYSIVRGAVAVAGGLDPAAGGITDRGLSGRPGQPVGGLAYGTHATGALAASGVNEDGYEWVYGTSTNHFPPHRKLDGLHFAGFDDPALTPPSEFEWLGPVMLPGDHDGDRCSYVVRYLTAEGESASPELQAEVEALPPPALSRLRADALADIAAGRYDTTTVRQVVEAERQANARPSQPATSTPITDAVRRRRDTERGQG